MQNSMKKRGHVHHARGVVHDDHAAEPMIEPTGPQRFVIHRQVQALLQECNRRKVRRSARP